MSRSFVLEPTGLSPRQQAEVRALLARARHDPPSLADIWRLMDEVWADLDCNEQRPDPVRLAAFYRHPIWALNGMFVEQDPQSRGHRKAAVAWLVTLQPNLVLDFGGGYGSMARMAAMALPETLLELYEPFPSWATVTLAAKHANLRLVSEPGRDYDAAICFDVLEHIPDPLPALAQLAAALRVGGLLAIANNFYPVIRCHLPATFYLRYSFPVFARLLGLHREGRLPGATAELYRKTREVPPRWGKLRALEGVSRLAFPALRSAHQAYRQAQGRPGGPI